MSAVRTIPDIVEQKKLHNDPCVYDCASAQRG